MLKLLRLRCESAGRALGEVAEATLSVVQSVALSEQGAGDGDTDHGRVETRVEVVSATAK